MFIFPRILVHFVVRNLCNQACAMICFGHPIAETLAIGLRALLGELDFNVGIFSRVTREPCATRAPSSGRQRPTL
jgi:hypothetical protein